MSDVHDPATSAAAVPVASATMPVRTPTGFWGNGLDQDDEKLFWLWRGYLAGGCSTLLTSQWKSGKTTLLSVLLARLKEGGELAGLPVAAAKAIVVSEEARLHWRPRHQRLDLNHVYFILRPFGSKPTLEQWLGLLDHVDQVRRDSGAALLAIDTIATLLPIGSEANPDAVLKALLPLQRLTEAGMAVLMNHHPRKGPSAIGEAARGSGAFPGFADFTIEMYRVPGAGPDDRRRRLLAYSRNQLTPSKLIIELNAEATDYATRDDLFADEFHVNWEHLRMVLEDANDKLDRRQIMAEWPPDFPRPDDSTLWRWLDRAAALGLVNREGSGRRGDPFRYWLPGREKAWDQDPMRELDRLVKESRKQMLELIDGKRAG